MKTKFLVIMSVFGTFLVSAQDIANVKQIGTGTIIVLRSDSSELARKDFNKSTDKLGGFYNDFIVVTQGSDLVVYDQNFKKIKANHLLAGQSLYKVVDNRIYIKDNGFIVIRDKNLEFINMFLDSQK